MIAIFAAAATGIAVFTLVTWVGFRMVRGAENLNDQVQSG